MAETTIIECPLVNCHWEIDATPPDIPDSALNSVFGTGTFAHMSYYQHQHKIEKELERHFATHTTVEMIETITYLRNTVKHLEGVNNE